MKCDELKRKYSDIMGPYYGYNEVNEAIEELLTENAELKQKLDKAIAERDGNQVCIDALKQKLEDAKATAYTESVDAGMENRKLKRALWLARAQRANEHYHRYHGKFLCPLEDVPEYVKWKQVECKCLKKAKEYR